MYIPPTFELEGEENYSTCHEAGRFGERASFASPLGWHGVVERRRREPGKGARTTTKLDGKRGRWGGGEAGYSTTASRGGERAS